MQSAILFAGIRGPDRKVACIEYPTSGIPIEPKMADYIRPTLAEKASRAGMLMVQKPCKKYCKRLL
jgi:hypothetical protein